MLVQYESQGGRLSNKRGVGWFVPWMLPAGLLLVGGPAVEQSAAQPVAGEKVVGGPYAVNVKGRSATVMWLVQTGEASLGSEPGKTEKTAPVLRAEKASFLALRPGTTYYYQAFPGEDGKGSFKTPPIGEAEFEFVVYGDTRTRHDVHGG